MAIERLFQMSITIRFILALTLCCCYPLWGQQHSPLSHGVKPQGFDSPQTPTDVPAALLEPLETHYPTKAVEQRIEGVVMIAAWIDDKGYVLYAEVTTSSGHEVLDEAALASVVDGYFRAAKRNGHPVASRVSIPVEFRLHRDEDEYDAVKSPEQLMQERDELRRAREMLEEEQRKLEEEIRLLKEQQRMEEPSE